MSNLKDANYLKRSTNQKMEETTINTRIANRHKGYYRYTML